jgi:hypothetical protein
VRDRPGTDQSIPVLLTLSPDTFVDIVGGPLQQDGFTWWKVRSANIEGWCAGEFLQPR